MGTMYTLDENCSVDGRFRIVRNMGWSGQSVCYEACDEKTEARVFFKQYHDLEPGQMGQVQGFFRQLGITLQGQQGLVCIPINLNEGGTYDPACGEAGNAIYAAYPWISEKTLEEKLVEGLLESEKIRIVMALVKTVHKLTTQRIAHLDLKPSNIMIQDDGRQVYIRLIDLDVARIDGRGVRNIGGTPFYMSPEHYTGEVCCDSDTFALSVLICMILFATHPFYRAASESEYRTAVASGQFTIPANNYHTEVQDAITKSLHPNMKCRCRIGRLYSVLTMYYGTDFRYLKARVRLSDMVRDPDERNYYDTTTFGRTQLRGLGNFRITHDRAFHLEMDLENGRYHVTLLDGEIRASLGTRQMQVNKPMYLSLRSSRLTINGVPLRIKLIPL